MRGSCRARPVAGWSYPSAVTLYRLDDPGDLVGPALVAALDGWIDAGSASTTAARQITRSGDVVATFDGDQLFDYRSRRPTLEIVDGRLSELTWPELVMRRARVADRDLLVLAGAEPDFRWHEFAAATRRARGATRRRIVDQPRRDSRRGAAHETGP